MIVTQHEQGYRLSVPRPAVPVAGHRGTKSFSVRVEWLTFLDGKEFIEERERGRDWIGVAPSQHCGRSFGSLRLGRRGVEPLEGPFRYPRPPGGLAREQGSVLIKRQRARGRTPVGLENGQTFECGKRLFRPVDKAPFPIRGGRFRLLGENSSASSLGGSPLSSSSRVNFVFSVRGDECRRLSRAFCSTCGHSLASQSGLGITTAPSDIFESPSRVGGWRELTPCLRVANGFFFLLGQDTPITHVRKLGDSYVRI